MNYLIHFTGVTCLGLGSAAVIGLLGWGVFEAWARCIMTASVVVDAVRWRNAVKEGRVIGNTR